MRISDGSSDVCSSDLIFGDQIGIVDEIERHAESLGHVAARSLSMNVARPGPYRTKERPPDRGPILLCPEPAHPGEAAPRASSPPTRRAATVSPSPRERKSVGGGKRVSVRVDLGGRGVLKNKKNKEQH